MERRLEDQPEPEKKGTVNNRFISTTDIDASIVRQGSRPKLYYKTHRAVDPASEIITATEVTSGNIDEAHRMTALMNAHQGNTGHKAETVVADSKYGTVDNFLECYDRGVRAHMPDLKAAQNDKGRNKDIYGQDKFIYDNATDTYVCPAGVKLKRKSMHESRQSIDYAAARKECAKCLQREQCTRNKS